jgi:hypothetical protein
VTTVAVWPLRWSRAAWFALAGLNLFVTLHTASMSGLSAAAIPLVLTVVVVAAIGFAFALSVSGEERLRPCIALRAGFFDKRSPARESDPDAAGHVRARAPGRS